MLYNICYITYPELLYNIQVWLYNIQDGYITHPNLPDECCHFFTAWGLIWVKLT